MISESHARYAALRGLKEARARELRNGLRTLRDGPSDPIEVKDFEERGLRETEQELDLALLQIRAETCRRIDGALRRLQTGAFGRCETCERAIPPARLRAVPFATRCRDCQAQAEESGPGLKPAA
jgi:DnaK suppressor protein